LSTNWKHASAPNLSRLQRQALDSFQQGRLDKAERLCAGILQYRPDDFDALQLLGLLNLQRRRLAEALQFLSKALKVNSTSAEALSNLLALHAMARLRKRLAVIATPC
jgi:Flp pilus assembly protein TadD